jgi:hypothetical protein
MVEPGECGLSYQPARVVIAKGNERHNLSTGFATARK